MNEGMNVGPCLLHSAGAFVVPCPPHTNTIALAIKKTREFYRAHTEIKASHGWDHIQAVLRHTSRALLALLEESSNNSNISNSRTLPSHVVMEIQLAALLHDVDDRKCFPIRIHTTRTANSNSFIHYPNASAILDSIGISQQTDQNADNHSSPSSFQSHDKILKMVSWVSCSANGNTVPKEIQINQTYHLLIPRWADRLEAVGSRGVVRCYLYNQEKNDNDSPLSSDSSPRPQTEEELWSIIYATPDKLQLYMDRGGTSTDMISHYYDKLLHIARPPKDIVRNPYLEEMAERSAKDMVELCLRYGMTGRVDEDFIKSLM